MLNPNNLFRASEDREEDSRRLSGILEALKTNNSMLAIGEYRMWWNIAYKVFEAQSITQDEVADVFKDGRAAIDYCLSNDPYSSNLGDSNENESQGQS